MNINFPKLEESILKFWQKNKIFERTLAKTKKRAFCIFLKGRPPPMLNRAFYHVLARIFKDVIPHYKTMQGYYVERKDKFSNNSKIIK